MNARLGLFALLLMTVNTAAWACDVPPLVAIPAAGDVGEHSARLIVEVQRYVAGIQSYTACVKADLAAAGGDAAPESLRSQLTVRNNSAVAEARAVLAMFGERVTLAENLYLAEFLSGAGEECIPAPRVESTAVVNDVAVLFVERGGRTYLNVLEQTCTDLARFGHFDIRGTVVDVSRPDLEALRTMRLCSNDFILPYAFEVQPLRNPECALGQFFEITQEQAVRLMALRRVVEEPPSE